MFSCVNNSAVSLWQYVLVVSLVSYGPRGSFHFKYFHMTAWIIDYYIIIDSIKIAFFSCGSTMIHTHTGTHTQEQFVHIFVLLRRSISHLHVHFVCSGELKASIIRTNPLPMF